MSMTKESFNFRRSSMPVKAQDVKICGENCTEGCAVCPYRDAEACEEEEHIDDV